ncbi:MAG: hypothetical protein ABI543_14320 [Ignavibacteria bacterium]
MKNSSLISIINSLSRNELKSLRNFLNSPYFNQNENVIKLFEYLILIDKKDIESITNKCLHEYVFKKQKFLNENIKTIIYLLTRLCENFIVINSFEKEETEFNKRLLSELNKKGLDKQFEKCLKKTTKGMPGETRIELNSIYRQAEFEREVIEYHTKRNNESEMFLHEQKLSAHLIAAFLVDMFKQYNIFWRTGYLDNVKVQEFTSAMLRSVDLNGLFRIFEENDYVYKNLLRPYYDIYRLLNDDENKSDVLSLKESIINNPDISDNEKFILSTILVNTLYYKNLKSGNRFSRELFEAFKLLLILYKYSGELHLRYTIFSNVLRLGLQLGEFEWTENFIKNSYVLLEPSVKENMFYYSSAFFSFAKNDFDKCLEYESKINFDTFQQRYYLRDLRLCSLYELGKFETALNLIDSYKHFIKKDTSYTPKMKQGYMLFLGFINDLIRLKLGISRKNLIDVNEKLKSSLPMRKDWLLKKFDEL